jgi:hypothetical protein
MIIRMLDLQGILLATDALAALRFAATGASPAAKRAIFVDDSVCLTADNVWNEGK